MISSPDRYWNIFLINISSIEVMGYQHGWIWIVPSESLNVVEELMFRFVRRGSIEGTHIDRAVIDVKFDPAYLASMKQFHKQ